jgi:hypothetical protein
LVEEEHSEEEAQEGAGPTKAEVENSFFRAFIDISFYEQQEEYEEKYYYY